MSTTLSTSVFPATSRPNPMPNRGVAPSRATLPSLSEAEARLSVSITAPSEKVTLCALAGEVDFYTADQFRSQVIGSLNTAGPLVVIDLSQVTFFGVAGLHVLIEARTWAGHTDRRIRLVTGPRCVDRLLEVAGDVAAFDTAANLVEALLDAA